MREVMDALAAAADPAMVVVTAAAGDDRGGCLVGFHSQASIHPLRWCVWISRQNHTYDIARAAAHLAVHFPATERRDLAEHFGGRTGDETGDKLADIAWSPAGDGVTPRLHGVAGFLGRILERPPTDGDHTPFVLEPVEAWGTAPSHPLRLHGADDIEPGHPA